MPYEYLLVAALLLVVDAVSLCIYYCFLGGGIALYNGDSEVIGALGVSGDTSCADHNIAWSALDALDGIGGVDAGISMGMIGVADAGIVYDTTNPYGHPICDTAPSGLGGLGNISLEDTTVVQKSIDLGAGIKPETPYAPAP